MTSFGVPSKSGKFYKGGLADTPWNEDLMWRMQIGREHKQLKQQETQSHSELLAVPRSRLGVSGTLIPSYVPLDATGDLLESESSGCGSSRGKLTHRSLASHQSSSSSLTSRSSASRSSRSYSSKSSSNRSGSSRYSDSVASGYSRSSSMSSLSSRQMNELKQRIEEQARALQVQASAEIATLKQAMADESKKREDAQKKVDKLAMELDTLKGKSSK